MPIKVTAKLWFLGVTHGILLRFFPESLLFVTLLLIYSMMLPATNYQKTKITIVYTYMTVLSYKDIMTSACH